MNFYRLKDATSLPPGLLRAQVNPVSYAKSIGVKMHGKVTIYGSSYHMFSSEHKPTIEYLASVEKRSLGIGHITGDARHAEYKRIFALDEPQ